MERKNATYRIKNERGEYCEIMLKTTAEQVLFADGRNLQEKLNNGDIGGGTGGGQQIKKIHTVHLFQINIVQQDLKLKIHLNVR